MAETLTRAMLRGDWQVLESSEVDNFASLPIRGLEAEGARLALDENGARHLLVRTGIPAREWSEADSPLKDAVRTLTFGGVRESFLDVRCATPRLFDVFDELVLDVLEASAGTADPGAAIDRSLGQWRAMFRAMSVGAFGKNRRYGLFAELTVLSACVEHIGASAIQMWTGPLGRPHDFELPNGCLEVKAVASTSTDVTIHGFGQLAIDRATLDLLVFSVAESADGSTLAEMIRSIETRVGAGALTAALARIGYATPGPDERLVITDSFAIRVTGQLPALTVETVDASALTGISHVEYAIPLALLTEHADARPVAALIASGMHR
ncbi:hypothetical protein J2Y46_003868 [Microbacterium sp. BE35]|uniref:PD-(D/E)XK motif protein n=1 Tax=Microbacterium sp. BE35 TaxID=2817773 RepID=UPI00285FF618|nr:PD-(D/E)XK motif protein [Microbacterium sp. BE35]MDR7191010.1 hypothetical protein [Microbacterium sp. BE35]